MVTTNLKTTIDTHTQKGKEPKHNTKENQGKMLKEDKNREELQKQPENK